MKVVYYNYAINIRVTEKFACQLICEMFGGKTSPNPHYNNNNQASHNVLVENVIICNLFIHKPYEPITTMQLIFCVTGKYRARTFINVCNLWEKTSPVIIKTTTTKLATMYW